MNQKITDFVQSAGKITAWSLGSFITLIGLFTLSSQTILGLSFIILGLFLIPPITKFLEEKTHQKLSGWRKPVIAVLFFFISGVTAAILDTHEPEKPNDPTLKVQEIPADIPEPIEKTPEPVKEPSHKTVKEVIKELEPTVPVTPIQQEKKIDESLTKVLKIVDGDTVDVLFRGNEERLRIQGINTPETKDPRYPVQCFGKEATQHAKDILEGKNIKLETDGSRGKYGRLLAYIRLLDGDDYGEKMIREGYAWHYRKYPHDRMPAYDKAEKIARGNNAGLWSSRTCNGEMKPAEEVQKETQKAVSEVIKQPVEKPTPQPEPIPEPPTPAQTYDCSGDKYNCGDFKRHTEAQSVFEYCLDQKGFDIHKMDRDNNGVACESLP